MSSLQIPGPPPNPHYPYSPTHLLPRVVASNRFPSQFDPLKTPYDPTQLPPLPRIRDPHLNAAARDPSFNPLSVPSVMELALLGDTALKTIIMERIQDLAHCGVPKHIASICCDLNENNLFSHLAVTYDLMDLKNHHYSPSQKSYADVFEAYIGALWRESGDLGKGHVRMVVREIFSPSVFPILAAWEAGQREFPRLWSASAMRRSKLRELKLHARRVQVGVSKALAIGGQDGARRDRRSRSRGPSVPPRPYIPRAPSPEPSRRTPITPRRASAPSLSSRPIIDLTLDDDESDMDDDDESVVFLSEAEWREINAEVDLEEAKWASAEAGPSRRSRTPSVFIDTEPSILSDSGSLHTPSSADDQPVICTKLNPHKLLPETSASSSSTSISVPPVSSLPSPRTSSSPAPLTSSSLRTHISSSPHPFASPSAAPPQTPVAKLAEIPPLAIAFPSDTSDVFGGWQNSTSDLPRPLPQSLRSELVVEIPRDLPPSAASSSRGSDDPRRLADWFEILSPKATMSAVPAKLKHPAEQKSHLRKLGDALGSVRSKVGAAFKRRAVQERVEAKRAG